MKTLNGLPAHVLLVHAIVVLLPLAAILLVVNALWPAARRKLAGPAAGLSVLVAVLVPITINAGEWLQAHVAPTPLVRDHAELGKTAAFVAIPVAILSLLVWWRHREELRGARGARTFLAPAATWVTVVLAVLSIVAAGAAGYDVYRIGDSGAQASWHGQFRG
ncbi:hypothetical protein [Amycolatopsis sp. WQ 127309]|uniref:hypothetical protein n=1 Tax=Amycolatopsis sp. WQ 127309 TaxID=2932773 RepID=UPI001FF4E296|nr:hypothetical protein [Amycolatopsis sp. WQ 127309]UOZ06956.1 hypothetical protein MUY22_01275 [Amycolatopsis sp. WQ 127309]